MQESELRALLERYRRGACSPAEVELVERWYETLGREQESLALTADETEHLRAALWQGIEERIDAAAIPIDRAARLAPRWGRWAAAAAVAALLIGSVAWLKPDALPAVAELGRPSMPEMEWVTQSNTSTHTIRVALQDGSSVRLSPNSRLRYPKQFVEPGRRVELTGEAFFEIARDTARPFKVYTDKVVTTVLGTSFTVRAFAGRAPAQVIVRTGKVRVTPRSAEGTPAAADAGIVLTPNQQVAYTPARPALHKELVAAPEIIDAQPFTFDDRPVAEVLTAIEKAYGLRIRYDEAALAPCTVTLTLGGTSLFEKMDLLCKTLNARYEVDGADIRLLAKGCARH